MVKGIDLSQVARADEPVAYTDIALVALRISGSCGPRRVSKVTTEHANGQSILLAGDRLLLMASSTFSNSIYPKPTF